MDRVIKFRAWDKVYERMNYKVQVGNTDYTDENYTCNSIWVDNSTSGIVGWMNSDDKCIVLMQFTGLHDKNGKEIYEFDILKSPATKEHIVLFENSMWGVKDKLNKVGGLNPFSNMNLNYWEVIGNRFENPELCE